jgi:S1-C subfamily serine protease
MKTIHTLIHTANLLRKALCLLAIGLAAQCQCVQAADNSLSRAARPASSFWENSVVTIDVSRKQYDYFQPWAVRTESNEKSGVVIAPRQIVTTADHLNDATLIRLQKGGRGLWVNARLQWIDYHANLALITTEDEGFWKGLEPALLSDHFPTEGTVQVVRWRNGNREIRKAEITRLSVQRAKLSFLEYFQASLDSEIDGAGWSEAVISEGMLHGLACAQDSKTTLVIPAHFIRFVVDGAQKGKGSYPGLGFFDFVWQKAENPATLSYLKLPGEPKGVILSEFVGMDGTNGLLQTRDVIVQIGNHAIDTDGDYSDPTYGHLSLENLATHNKWAGENVLLKVWRNGQYKEITYPLPKVDYSKELVSEQVFDQAPEYLMVGGLIFQPLTGPYLRNWGADWRRKAPFRLAYYDQDKPTSTYPSRVLLSIVLPDAYNMGYQDYRFMVLDKVNGLAISNLRQLAEALTKPINGFHEVEFAPGEAVHRLVLDGTEMETATRRVMQRYGIEKDRVLAPAP